MLSLCFCLQCFACSVELGGHKKSHNYHIFVSYQKFSSFCQLCSRWHLLPNFLKHILLEVLRFDVKVTYLSHLCVNSVTMK